jgi:hypothetical protein
MTKRALYDRQRNVIRREERGQRVSEVVPAEPSFVALGNHSGFHGYGPQVILTSDTCGTRLLACLSLPLYAGRRKMLGFFASPAHPPRFHRYLPAASQQHPDNLTFTATRLLPPASIGNSSSQ